MTINDCLFDLWLEICKHKVKHEPVPTTLKTVHTKLYKLYYNSRMR